MQSTAAKKTAALSEEEILEKKLFRNGIITIAIMVVSFVLGIISIQ
jgi:hypothetical protein